MNKKVSIIIGVVIAALLVAVAALFFTAAGKVEVKDSLLSSNFALFNRDEIPDYDLNTNDSLLRFKTYVADLGKMKIGQEKRVVFSFTNACSTPVVITKIVTMCGCTSVDYDKVPIMPGKVSEIEVTFEAEEKGVFFKKLLIYYAGGPSSLEIAIKGEVVRR